MNTELTYNQVLELLPAYALGALEPEEVLAVETYLNRNRALLDRFHQAELAAAQMAHAAPEAPLPAGAKDRLMARVLADLAGQDMTHPKANPIPQPAKSPYSSQPEQIPTPARSPGWLVGLRRAFSPVNGWAVASGCALVVLVVILLYMGQLQARLSQLNSQLDSLQAEINQLQVTNTQLQETNESLQQQLQTNQNRLQQAGAALDALQAQIDQLQAANSQLQQTQAALQQQAQTDQELLALIAQADLERTVHLRGTEAAPQANGTFFMSGNNQALLVLRELEPLPAKQTYQLWLIPAAGPPQSAGLVAVQANIATWLTLSLPAAQDFAAIGVSVEPAGGSLAPTTVVLLGPVS